MKAALMSLVLLASLTTSIAHADLGSDKRAALKNPLVKAALLQGAQAAKMSVASCKRSVKPSQTPGQTVLKQECLNEKLDVFVGTTIEITNDESGFFVESIDFTRAG